MEVDGVDGQMRFWRNTRVADLSSGQSTTLGSGILGYEWDESPDNGYQPAGLIRLSTTTRNGVDYLQDYGSTYAPGSATHHLTMYRAPSGALVFGAGTVQWAWGLDNNHSGGSGTHLRRRRPPGDGQPLRRHGRAASNAAIRPLSRERQHRHCSTDVDHLGTGRRRHRSGRPAADGQRHRDR